MSKKKVTLLGINDGHDTVTALVQTGLVIAAAYEERLYNIR